MDSLTEFIIDRNDLKFRYIVYSTGDVFNLDTGKKIKPSKDKRRPNESPIIYFKRKDDKRHFIYQDELIARIFIKDYDEKTMSIIHLDGDVENCSLDNLYVKSGLDVLKNIYHETKRWCRVHLEFSLYYDYYICEDGRLFNGTTNSFIKPFRDNRESKSYEGALRYNLYTSKSIKDTVKVSAGRLVALHFLVKPEGKDIVLYHDGNFENVDVSNLSWGDRYDAYNKRVNNSREFTSLRNEAFGEEKWKELDIDGFEFEDEYLVSNFGRVYNKSKGFYVSQVNTNQANLNNQYHKYVSLKTVDSGFKPFFVHRLVGFMFVKNKNPDINICINHINGNPECNFADNLEWCTPYENLHHAIETNLRCNKSYIGRVDEDQWRMNTYFAWIYTIKGMTDAKAYNFFNVYKGQFNEDLPDLTFEEFAKLYNEKLNKDQDFIKLKDFYESNYL